MMYLLYFNEEKLWVPKVPWVSWHTANFMVQYIPTPGAGLVWEKATLGIPILNPNRLCHSIFHPPSVLVLQNLIPPDSIDTSIQYSISHILIPKYYTFNFRLTR